MKKIIRLFVALSLALTLIPKIEVNALDYDKIYEQELKEAIISGDGTADHPYIVDYEKAPYFKEYMDNINEKVMDSLQGISSDESISTYGIYDNVLKGTKHTNQTNGGYWYYTSGAPNTVSNGNIWMRRVEYISINDTKNIKNALANSMYKNIISSSASEIINKPFDDIFEKLIEKGLPEVMAQSVLKALGKINSLFTAVEISGFINNCFKLATYDEAVNYKYGMINAVYYTSYQGSWYEHQGEDTWTTAPTAYEPSSYYGSGIYRSH